MQLVKMVAKPQQQLLQQVSWRDSGWAGSRGETKKKGRAKFASSMWAVSTRLHLQ